MGGGHGIGIKRNDYHRRNRRANISMHSKSAGSNTESTFLRILNTPIHVPAYDRDELIEMALRHMAARQAKRGDNEAVRGRIDYICATYLRHEHSPYESLLGSRKWKNQNRDTYLLVFKRVMDAIAESNPWLADTCKHQYEEKSGAAFSLHKRVRVIKGGGLTSLHVQEHNEREAAAFSGVTDGDSHSEEDEIAIYHAAISSLASHRLLFFPPFLKRYEIRERRFGGHLNMNDRWWEWEAELDFISWRGRLNETKHLD